MLLAGCSDDDGDKKLADGGGTDTGTGDTTTEWTVRMVEDASVGLQSRMALGPGDTLGLAYFANASYEDGICDEVEVDPPTRLRQELRFAYKGSADDSWTAELIDAPVEAFGATGLDLEYDADGNPAVVYTGGDPQDQFCGSNDAVLAVRGSGGWTMETASAESGDSATGEPASDSGMVVGYWPSLAYDPAGEPAVVHKDVHYGSLQSDDFRRADAEFAWRSGGSWIHEAIDYGDGAGNYSEIVFDTEGRPVAFYLVPTESQTESRHGVWAARRETTGEWTQVKLHTGGIHEEIAAGVHPDTGELLVAFYSAGDLAVRVRRLSDYTLFEDASSWSTELVCKNQFDEGRYVSMAFTPSGKLALAYHRCRLLSSDSEACDPNEEAVVLALEGASGWTYDTAAEADTGSCGEYTSLAIDSAGTAHIAYRCTVQIDNEFTFRLFVASKDIE